MTISAADRQPVLACPTLSLEAVSSSADHRVGPSKVYPAPVSGGPVEQMDDEGERFWAVTIVVLEEDLG
ncbi:hypothetical protein [Acidisphaera sp. L21]|uniref:hypothetical protein n=1 Tax=Acidisphaera sp. L21 TaxID=1641851 RepID=UPI00131E0252|nr:hypothetical protein [Acidisphaera sp. L21]